MLGLRPAIGINGGREAVALPGLIGVRQPAKRMLSVQMRTRLRWLVLVPLVLMPFLLVIL